MSNETLTLLSLPLIPLAILATILALFLLVRYWRASTLNDLKRMRSELRRVESEQRQLSRAFQIYSPQDPPPYGERAALLNDQLNAASQQIDALQYRLVAMQEQVRRLYRLDWQTIVGAPYFWYLLRKDVAALLRDLAPARSALASASQAGNELSRLGWEAALQARQVYQLHQQTISILLKLQARGVHCDAIEEAAQLEAQSHQAIAQLPTWLMSGEETEVLELADKASVTAAHQTISLLRPGLEGLLAQAQAWEQGYIETVGKVDILRQAMSSLEATLKAMPQTLNLSAHKSQFEQLTVITQNLEATLTRLEIDSMPAVSAEATRLAQLARDSQNQLEQAQAQLPQLENALVELAADLKLAANRFAALGSNLTLSVTWGESLTELTLLNRQANALKSPTQRRTPEEVLQDLPHTQQLAAQLKDLVQRLSVAETQHAGIIAILASTEFKQSKEWLVSARALSQQVQAYAPENFARADSIASLQGDLDVLEEDLARLAPAGIPQVLPEVELPTRLEQAQQLAESYSYTQARVSRLQMRLSELQQTDQATRLRLENTRSVLAQLAFIIHSNKFLSNIATAELARLQSDVEKAQAELSEPPRGMVERKAKSAASLVARVESNANLWLDKLNKDNEAALQSISASLSNLDTIAPIEDNAVTEARRLLTTGQPFPVGSQIGKPDFRLEQLSVEFKRRNDLWQSCTASLRALQDNVVKPVSASYARASQSRQSAQDALSEIEALSRSRRPWPPTSISIDTERQELSAIEAQWHSLKQRSYKAIDLVAQLGTLSSRYERLVEKLRQYGQRAAQEAEQIADLEAELDEFTQSWQVQLQTYQDNPTASREIKELLDGIRAERNNLQRLYRQGANDYSQTLQSLKAIQRKLRYFQVALDDDHALDMNGRVIKRR